ncbi:MAG: HigA family addiction module antidote protein [Ktedonobacteraceae bacterium]|nr:HigA family addiction module antidote protein [Ktedonobacteraceae bacterium]
MYPIHPGEILAEELVELNKSPTELARELHVPANRISQLVAGKRAMTADTALRLERWLGVSAAFWMNLQKRYELDIARERSDDVLKAIEPLHRASPTLKMQQLFLIMFIASYSCNVLHVVAKE